MWVAYVLFFQGGNFKICFSKKYFLLFVVFMQFVILSFLCCLSLSVVGIVSESHKVIQSLTFAPPYSERLLPSDIRRTNNWVIAGLHGIEWNQGLVPYSKLG